MRFMLWLDGRPISQREKLSEAVQAYQKKYGHSARVAFFNPAEGKPDETIEGIQVKTQREVLRGHIWITQETE